MRKLMWLTMMSCLILASFAALLQAGESEEEVLVNLRSLPQREMVPGDTLHVVSKEKGDMHMVISVGEDLPEQEMDMNQEKFEEYFETILELDDNGPLRYERRYGNAFEDDFSPEMPNQEGLANKTFSYANRVVLYERNQKGVGDFRFQEEDGERVVVELDSADLERLREELERDLKTDNFEEWFREQLPETPMKIGESFPVPAKEFLEKVMTDKESEQFDINAQKSKMRITLTAVTNKLITLQVTGEIVGDMNLLPETEDGGEGFGMKMEMQFKGSMQINRITGYLQNSDAKIDIVMEGENNMQGMKMTIDATGTIDTDEKRSYRLKE